MMLLTITVFAGCLLYTRHHAKGFLLSKSHSTFGIALWDRYHQLYHQFTLTDGTVPVKTTSFKDT